MGEYTRGELAQRAGVSIDFVDRLVELRIVSPDDGDFPGAGTFFLAAYLRFKDIPPFVFYILLLLVGSVVV